MSDQENDNDGLINENGLYFDKRHKKEETPYHFSEEIQNHYATLEDHFNLICPKTSLDEALVKNKF